MKTVFNVTVLAIFAIIVLPIGAWGNCLADTAKCKPVVDSVSNTAYYLTVDSMPEYPGGPSEMLKFIYSNFNYPPETEACCTVVVEFIIDPNGEMKDLKIKRRLEKRLDDETLRVFQLMPVWKPGKCDGRPVPVKYVVPLKIALE